MKTYQGSEIRNVAVVGHAHSGKSTLIAALLHAAKMTPTQGRVADGSAVTAYDEEEIARGTTMQNAVAFAEWQGTKINFVDTPGFHMFTHEARAALLPVEAAAVIVNAQNGVEPVTERVWRYAEEANVPRIVVINQMDHPKAGGGGGLSALIDDLHDRWGRNCVPVQLPISDADGFPRRCRPRHHGGLLLHSRRRRPRQNYRRDSRQPRCPGQGRATKRWSNSSPKAKTS